MSVKTKTNDVKRDTTTSSLKEAVKTLRDVATSTKTIPLPVPSVEPLPAASVSIACDRANENLWNDLQNCTKILNEQTYNSTRSADDATKKTIQCICSSSWNPNAPDLKYVLQPSCYPPGQFSKSDMNTVYGGCNSAPFQYAAIAESLGVFAKLDSGEYYKPFSITSSAEKFIDSIWIAALGFWLSY